MGTGDGVQDGGDEALQSSRVAEFVALFNHLQVGAGNLAKNV